MQPLSVLETCLYVDDLDVAQQFYADVVGLEFVSRRAGRHVFFRCGHGMLLIFAPAASNAADSDLPRHGAIGAGHVAFAIADTDLDAWRDWLVQHNVTIEQEVEWPAGRRSAYFRDPAGNLLEVVSPRLWGFDEFPTSDS